ncbi:hypothetical protein NADFUDRAFT_71470 [Nadsonia fulvescens var. elongata DSM 6958]|uniref:RRM domain-containing protein n=1 Tax=Nadsonia fulvescens var. elongata DSM 6958 TaxID=857566 RepID=A0A1E3PFZ8_9ASCO|nr:hypothetical protein NADFUDRAFT_71470 [Nadsonia fulvescens var. elongata DSM 6958]
MNTPGRVIYVGSIPYDQTEEQVLDIFRSVGPVANFRLVFDKDTGKSKGYGFVEYHDADTAASAVRNLNNYTIGNRNIRVDFSHETSIGPNVFTSRPKDPNAPAAGAGVSVNLSSLNLPPGITLPPGVSAAESITNTLSQCPRETMLQVVTELQTLVVNSPQLAIDLFRACPQLSYALVQSCLALGLVDPMSISAVVLRESPEDSNDGAGDEAQKAIIRQVLSLTTEQIQALPEQQRMAIDQLREKVRSGQLASI